MQTTENFKVTIITIPPNIPEAVTAKKTTWGS